jgi:hypothetical protein
MKRYVMDWAFGILFCLTIATALPGADPFVYTSIDYPGAQHTFVWSVSYDSLYNVGSFIDAQGVQHGFAIMNAYGRKNYKQIDFPNATATVVTNIEDGFAGYYVDAAGQEHGFYSRVLPFIGVLRLQTFDYPEANQTVLTVRNRWGMAGFYDLSPGGAGVDHAFVCTTSCKDISIPGARATVPTNITSTQAVGFYVDSEGIQHGFLSQYRSNKPAITFDYPGTPLGTRLYDASNIYMMGLKEYLLGVYYTQYDAGTPFAGANSFLIVWDRYFFSIKYPGSASTSAQKVDHRFNIVGTWLEVDPNTGAEKYHGFVASPTRLPLR